MPSAFTRAWADIAGGIAQVPIWGILGWQDIRQRYRRSVLGPFWLTISTGVMISAIAFVYAKLFNQTLEQYIPFVAAGLIVWSLILSIVNEACNVFIAAEGIIKQVRLPLTVHVCRMVWRNFNIFFHNAVILCLIYFFYGQGLRWNIVAVPLGLAVIGLHGVWLGIVFGIFCTRFCDVPLIISNIMQVVFFVSPIMWRPKVLGADRSWIADYNPVYHLIELIRAPFLSEAIPVLSWVVSISTGVLGMVIALLVLKRYRHRVAYWL
jgi:lipopolysaccharide transport system permease protein